MTTEQYSDYDVNTVPASFKTFYSIKKAEKFASDLAKKFNCDIDIINNRQRKKWKKLVDTKVTLYHHNYEIHRG